MFLLRSLHPTPNGPLTAGLRYLFQATAVRVLRKMRVWAFLLAIPSWGCLVAVLTFGPDFNGTVPSILGITNFSDSTASGQIQSGFADGVVNTNLHQP